MKHPKTKAFILLISLLVLHAPILQAQGGLSQCEQDARNLCNQPCIEAVPTVQECLVANPNFPPPVCVITFNNGVALCESEVTVVELTCESAYIIANCDTTSPTVTITAPSNSDTAFSVTITFSESVSGFVVGELIATNANVSAFAGSGSTYTATITPISAGTNVVISVAAGVATDAASNANTAASNATVIIINASVNPSSIPTLSGVWAMIFLMMVLGFVGYRKSLET